jgi:hypothetical protein
MMKAMRFVLLFLATVLVSTAGVIFSENFSGATPGDYATTGVLTGTNFTLTAGSIDVDGTGWYADSCVAPTSGNCIDTTGYGNMRGVLTSTNAISFSPGQYLLSFDLAGWSVTSASEGGPQTESATVEVDLGTLVVDQQYFRNGSLNPYPTVYIPFTVTSTTAANLVFTDLSGTTGYAGAILDDIEIQSVPEPGSLMLIGAGALILLARKRARK